MTSNVSSPQMYAPPNLMPIMPDAFNQMPVQNIPTYQGIQPGVLPVYNNIPYNPVYGNSAPICPYGQTQKPFTYAPKISTVSIELNGLEPPKVPGFNDNTQMIPMPIYPNMTQMQPMSPYSMENTLPPVRPLPVQEITPPPPAIDQPQAVQAFVPTPVSAPVPPPVVTPVETIAQTSVEPDPKEAVKPLLDAISIVFPKAEAAKPTVDQQSQAIQTIAQFARVTEATNQLAQTDIEKPEVKKAKDNIDKLVKPALINEDTFIGLANIATGDTTNIAGEDKKKADENRITSMWTLAMLQKIFKNELNNEAKKINIPPISMDEVPGIVQVTNLVIGDKEKNLPPDPNPEIREAGIAALVNLADPKDPKDVQTMRAILSVAQADKAQNVKATADEAMKAYL